MLPRLFSRMRPDHPLSLQQRGTERLFDQFGRAFMGDGG